MNAALVKFIMSLILFGCGNFYSPVPLSGVCVQMSLVCHPRENGDPDHIESAGFPIEDFGNDGQKAEFIRRHYLGYTMILSELQSGIPGEFRFRTSGKHKPEEGPHKCGA